MKGKIRILLDAETEYIAVVETLGSRINQLNKEISHDEENVQQLQINLQNVCDTLSKHIKGRNQMLETLKKLNAVKRQKNIDVIAPNPSEKLTLDNPQFELCLSEEEWNRLEEQDKERKLKQKEEEEANKNANNTN